MNTLYALLSVHALGFLWLVLLFAVCFLIVHTVRLAKLGRRYQQERKHVQPTTVSKSPEEKKTPPPSEGEPVYYIVERKRRAKSSYGEPKRIHFK